MQKLDFLQNMPFRTVVNYPPLKTRKFLSLSRNIFSLILTSTYLY